MTPTNIAGHLVIALLTAGLCAAIYLTVSHISFAAGITLAVVGWAAVTATCLAFNSLAGGEEE